MKKTLLSVAALLTGAVAMSQTSVVFTEHTVKSTPLPAGMTKDAIKDGFLAQRNERMRKNAESKLLASKGARTTSRTYNYVDFLSKQTPDILNNSGFSYMWNSFDGYANYSSGYDTINTVSFGQLIQPWYSRWNSVFAYNGEPSLARDAAYNLDTVLLYGVYPRNPDKPNVVDTMIMTFFEGDGSPTSNVVYDFRTPDSSITTANLGLDTLKFAYARYDSAGTTAARNSGGSAIKTVRFPMANPFNDTTVNGLKIVRVPVNLKVPAGHIVGMTYTFKTGDPTFTPYDTVLLATGTNQVAPKFNVFRPQVFEQNNGGYPTYYPDSNYNNGLLQLYPLGGRSRYLAMYFLTAPSAGEFSNVDFVISSTEFDNFLLNVNNVAAVTVGKIFPNPANGSINVPVMANTTTSATITITNTLGQVMLTKSAALQQANTATTHSLDVRNLSSGIYFCTVLADGQQSTQRFTIF